MYTNAERINVKRNTLTAFILHNRVNENYVLHVFKVLTENS